eukprot:XP_024444481.1 LOW QUALITY PROTEIN: kiwellin [Populus trichocarpa]
MDKIFVLVCVFFLRSIISSHAISSCNGPCNTFNDCDGQLICIKAKCNDDPDVGTHICKGGGSSPSSPPLQGNCPLSGERSCKEPSFPAKYKCSPPVTSTTKAKLTLNDFSEGGEGGAPSECDERYHAKTERVVALSTGWYDGGSRCGRMIKITASNGKSVTAKVVDECDTLHGCDREHGFLPPCENNIVDGSDAVWEALGLNKDLGIVPVTWSMA